MSVIIGLMGLERLELFTLELEKLLHLALFTLKHLQLLTNGTKLVKLYMTIKVRLWL